MTNRSSIYGGGGNDTLNFLSGVGGTLMPPSLMVVTVQTPFTSMVLAFYGVGTIAGGAGNDSITMASQSLSAAAAGGLGTIYGGAGNDLITLASFSQIASVSGVQLPLLCLQPLSVLSLTSMLATRFVPSLPLLSAGASTAVNWAGGAGTITSVAPSLVSMLV